MKLRSRNRRRARIRVPKRPELAAPPGSIPPPANTPPPEVALLRYTTSSVDEGRLPPHVTRTELSRDGAVSWINVEGVGNAEVLESLGRLFDWHPLVLEDIVSLHQRPKTEEYDDHAYVVIHMPSGSDGLPLEQLSMLFGQHYVVTIQGGIPGDALDAVRDRIRKGRGKIRSEAGDYLAYAIIDAVIDHYFPIVERLNSRLEAIEARLGSSPGESSFGDIHAIRNDLHTIWRTVSATREAISRLIRTDMEFVTEGTRLYLRDCHDHCAQLLDATVACRELSSSLMELHQSQVSNRMSEGMRVLTLVATIFMPMNFVAAVYGMNFDQAVSPFNMPELGWYFGYPFALTVMIAIGGGFALYFRRSAWFSKGSSGSDKSES